MSAHAILNIQGLAISFHPDFNSIWNGSAVGTVLPSGVLSTKLLTEIAELKEQLHKHGKAIARIEHWHTRKVSNPNTQAREVEKQTLETVLRIFKEETEK